MHTEQFLGYLLDGRRNVSISSVDINYFWGVPAR